MEDEIKMLRSINTGMARAIKRAIYCHERLDKLSVECIKDLWDWCEKGTKGGWNEKNLGL